MLFLLLEFSNIFCNHSVYLDYFHIQVVFDLVMDLWKVKYIYKKNRGCALASGFPYSVHHP
jgi:hypothetical protein